MSGGFVVLIIDILVLAAWLIFPLFRRGEDDKGDGFATVILPTPSKCNPLRTAFFYAASIGGAVAVVGFSTPIAHAFGATVADLVNGVTGRPDLTRSWDRSIVALVPVIAAANIAVFGLSLRASIPRRLMALLNAFGGIVVTISLDSLMLVLWHSSGGQVGLPTTIGVVLINVAVGTAVILRVIVTSLQLPRPTATPLLRKRFTADGVLAAIVVVVAIGFVAAVVSIIHMWGSVGWLTLASHVTYPMIWIAIFVGLLVIASRGPLPDLIPDRPPIDVIIPAYNETAGIHLTLRSIDRAAALYGGPVHVILADDGSTDGTGDLARAEMAAFTAATGIVVPGGHHGKSPALNTALGFTKSLICVRVDADIIVHEECLIPLPTWFSDPSIGSVGSMTYPRQDGRSYFHKMRLFECLLSFGFTRQAQARVNAIACIPGTFTAFRRDACLALGGFVCGMNGEDTDLTMLLGRLGYRVIIEPRCVVFEDVPPTLPQFREQRIRWNRAGSQVFARHSPFTSGFAGPRVWLTYFRITSVRFTSIVRPTLFAYLIANAVASPSSRPIELLLLGSYAISQLPSAIAISCVAFRHRLTGRLGWLLLYWPFTMLRRVFAVEALFTIPTRGVRPPAEVWRQLRSGRRLPGGGTPREPEPARPAIS
jgi:cellulose synthase/poly-beta-1,6-N-acetylglucosamine synthase-like glycosyltransferase